MENLVEFFSSNIEASIIMIIALAVDFFVIIPLVEWDERRARMVKKW